MCACMCDPLYVLGLDYAVSVRRLAHLHSGFLQKTIWLLIVYKKAKFDNLPTSFLVELKQGVEDAL